MFMITISDVEKLREDLLQLNNLEFVGCLHLVDFKAVKESQVYVFDAIRSFLALLEKQLRNSMQINYCG